MLDVISVGSATEDVFVYVPRENFRDGVCIFYPGSKVEIETIGYYTGGGATNTAVAFSRLGLRAAALCAVGQDESGRTVIGELKKEKVDTRLVKKVRGSNTPYSVILTGFGRDRVVLCYGGTTAMLVHANIDWKKSRAKWFYVTSLHSEKAALLSKIAGHARKNGAKIAFNPGKAELAMGLVSLRESLGVVDVLIMNNEEALKLTGSADIRRNLKKLSELGKIVVITEGRHGAHATEGKKCYSMGIFDVKVADVTGAGDAFGSGFCAAIMHGLPIEKALAYGTANATSVVMHLGTKNILLRKNEVDGFIRKYSGKANRVQIGEL